MTSVLVWIRSIAAFVAIAGVCSAQHLQAEANFESGASATFELINFDVGSSGGGTIFVANGAQVNIPIGWTRVDGKVIITIQGGPHATLKNAGQNSLGGDATIHDGQDTDGKWERTQ